MSKLSDFVDGGGIKEIVPGNLHPIGSGTYTTSGEFEATEDMVLYVSIRGGSGGGGSGGVATIYNYYGNGFTGGNGGSTAFRVNGVAIATITGGRGGHGGTGLNKIDKPSIYLAMPPGKAGGALTVGSNLISVTRTPPGSSVYLNDEPGGGGGSWGTGDPGSESEGFVYMGGEGGAGVPSTFAIRVTKGDRCAWTIGAGGSGGPRGFVTYGSTRYSSPGKAGQNGECRITRFREL